MGSFLLLLFPTGQLPSRRWRPVAWISGVGLGVFMLGVVVDPTVLTDMLPGTHNPLAPVSPQPVGAVLQSVGGVALLAVLLASAAAFLLRLRRSTSVERQQLKWFAYACGMVVAGQVFGPVMQALGAEGNWVWVPLLIAIAGIPISIGIAILRYRLYDIDRLINRTLVYGLLTAILGGVYATVVLLFGQLVGGIGAAPRNWVVAGATLAVAALFRPARRRIQQAVDRRFNRRKYDAARTVEAFATWLRAFELGGCRRVVPSCTRSSRGVVARPVSNLVSIGGFGPVRSRTPPALRSSTTKDQIKQPIAGAPTI
jgi:hypothetical protein